MTGQGENDAERETINRDDTAWENAKALSKLMEQHHLFIPARDYPKWRPTVPTAGVVDGFYREASPFSVMTCIATDGILAYFLLADDSTWIGHVGHFRWNEEVVSMVPYLKNGEVRYFKSVKDCGAPAALFKKTPPPRAESTKKAKPKKAKAKTKRQQLLEEI